MKAVPVKSGASGSVCRQGRFAQEIKNNVAPGATLYTDKWVGYRG